MRWYEVLSDTRVDWCSAAVAATARSAVGRTAVISGPDDAMGNGLDDGTGKEAAGFLTMVLPDLLGRKSGDQAFARKEFTPEHLSAYAHVVGFHPPPVTSLVVQRTGAMPHCP